MCGRGAFGVVVLFRRSGDFEVDFEGGVIGISNAVGFGPLWSVGSVANWIGPSVDHLDRRLVLLMSVESSSSAGEEAAPFSSNSSSCIERRPFSIGPWSTSMTSSRVNS